MLPFLSKPKSIAGILIEKRKPDAKPVDQSPDDSQVDPIEPYASDLIDAIQSQDIPKAAQALRDAFNALQGSDAPQEQSPDESQESQ